MAFFHREDAAWVKHIIDDLVSRAVGLIAWQQVGEVLPYYCEGLIHLDILFASGVVTYEGQIQIDYDRYDEMKQRYTRAYQNLAQTYIDKSDAQEFLDIYITKEDGVYLPNHPKVRAFVEQYYKRYTQIGQQVYQGQLQAPQWELPEELG